MSLDIVVNTQRSEISQRQQQNGPQIGLVGSQTLVNQLDKHKQAERQTEIKSDTHTNTHTHIRTIITL